MKAFAVEHPLHKPGMSILHYKLFHGQQTRGSPYRAGIPFFGDKENRPLRITRNVRRIPEVFAPVSSLVISARVRDALGELPFVEYRAVSFPELVDFEAPALGDTSWENNPALREAAESEEWPGWPDNLFEYLPQASEEQQMSVGSYYEMVVPHSRKHWPSSRMPSPSWCRDLEHSARGTKCGFVRLCSTSIPCSSGRKPSSRNGHSDESNPSWTATTRRFVEFEV